MNSTTRICLWSGPRNISTALMYAFAQRTDTKVFDEPLYGYYLQNHPQAKTYHPGADLILEKMENDGENVVNMMLENTEKPVLFFKQMTHHLWNLKRDFMKKMVNVILTRDPEEMLPSFNKVIKNPTIDDVGYAMHIELIEYFKTHQIPFVVLDAKKVLLNPKETLQKLCVFVNIPFDYKMLSWQPQQLKEDGVWAKYWYKNVHLSHGFMPYKPKEEKISEHLKPLLNECLTHYNQLITYSI